VSVVGNFSNLVQLCDVNGDGSVTPLDALQLINEINLTGPRVLSGWNTGLYLDVNRDLLLTPQDVLAVVNYLNASAIGGAAGEGEAETVPLAIGAGESVTLTVVSGLLPGGWPPGDLPAWAASTPQSGRGAVFAEAFSGLAVADVPRVSAPGRAPAPGPNTRSQSRRDQIGESFDGDIWQRPEEFLDDLASDTALLPRPQRDHDLALADVLNT
jgi:hypothetical protein